MEFNEITSALEDAAEKLRGLESSLKDRERELAMLRNERVINNSRHVRYRKSVHALPSYRGNWEGIQFVYNFPNGYGASAICHEASYGGRYGEFEIAVLDDRGELCYSTPVANDVIGNLCGDSAVEVLDQIFALPALPRRI